MARSPTRGRRPPFFLPERDSPVSVTLAEALSIVKRAIQAAAAEDRSTYPFLLWKSAAEAEYAAFQLSMTQGLSDFNPTSNHDEADVEPTAEAAHELLLYAQSCLQSKPRDAYFTIRNAVTILRKMSVAAENLSKGQRARPESEE